MLSSESARHSILVRVPGGNHISLLPDQLNALATWAKESGIFWLNQPSVNYASLRCRLLGGKGGFGSNLRAQGNKMSAKRRHLGTDDYRDLRTGQTLRSINENRMIEEYLCREPEMIRQREAEQRERALRAIETANRKPKFSDVEFLQKSREMVDAVEAAVRTALVSNSSEDDYQSHTSETDHGSEDEQWNNEYKTDASTASSSNQNHQKCGDNVKVDSSNNSPSLVLKYKQKGQTSKSKNISNLTQDDTEFQENDKMPIKRRLL